MWEPLAQSLTQCSLVIELVLLVLMMMFVLGLEYLGVGS